MSEKQSCLNCRWADYLKTRTGRLMRRTAVWCYYPADRLQVEIDTLRAEVPAAFRASVDRVVLSARGMLPGDADGFGANCPTWEASE